MFTAKYILYGRPRPTGSGKGRGQGKFVLKRGCASYDVVNCMHLAKEKESADDLYQDAFLEATKKIASIRYEDNPKSYLLSIVIRLWKNRVRKRAWRSRIAPQVAEEAIEESTAVSGSDMVERVVKEEEKAHLWKAVDALSDVYRIPLLLYYMENQNVPDG